MLPQVKAKLQGGSLLLQSMASYSGGYLPGTFTWRGSVEREDPERIIVNIEEVIVCVPSVSSIETFDHALTQAAACRNHVQLH